MPRAKYATEEERKAAKREYQRKYREAHKQELNEANRRYVETHKEEVRRRNRDHQRAVRGTNCFNEELSSDDIIADSSVNSYVISEMNKAVITPEYEQFVSLLRSKGIENEEDIQEILVSAQRATFRNRTQHGFYFEQIILKALLNMIKDTSLYVYKQVPINNHTCRIDFVISNQKVQKDDLDIAHSVIVSTKTQYGMTGWREDMHLYDKCRAYFMVTLSDKVPTETLPDNVYFASPNFSTLSEHVINLDSLKDLIIKAFEETS